MTEGKLLGHIVSKDGVRIDPERVATIDKVPQSKIIKGIYSFFGQINFLRRFVTNFAEISRPISKMLKKGAKLEWEGEPTKAFQEIKKAIKNSPIPKAPNYGKPMEIFSFASFHTVFVVFMQKNSEDFEQPIAFFSKSFLATKLKYDLSEKKAYALVKVVKDFRSYLMGVTMVAYMPSVVVKDIFTQ